MAEEDNHHAGIAPDDNTNDDKEKTETKTTDEKTGIATDDKNDIANDKTNTIVDIYEKEVKEDEDEVIIIKGI